MEKLKHCLLETATQCHTVPSMQAILLPHEVDSQLLWQQIGKPWFICDFCKGCGLRVNNQVNMRVCVPADRSTQWRPSRNIYISDGRGNQWLPQCLPPEPGHSLPLWTLISRGSKRPDRPEWPRKAQEGPRETRLRSCWSLSGAFVYHATSRLSKTSKWFEYPERIFQQCMRFQQALLCLRPEHHDILVLHT